MSYCDRCGTKFGDDWDVFGHLCATCKRAKQQEELAEEREQREAEREQSRQEHEQQLHDERLAKEEAWREEDERRREQDAAEQQYADEERQRRQDEIAEERAEQRLRNQEEALERNRLAKIAHDVETLCRAAERKLAANRPTYALEDAESAVDIDPTNWSALNLAYSAAKQASNRAAASKYLERLVKLHAAGSRRRYQTDSTESDRLLVEAASEGAGSDSLVMTLVDAYRSPPVNLRDVLNKIGRKDLLGAWLDTRVKRFSAESPGFPIESFLDAIAALPDGAARISKLSGELFEHIGFNPSTAAWLTNNGHAKEAAAYIHSCSTGLDPNGLFVSSFAEWSITNGFHADANEYVRRLAPNCNPATRVSRLIPLALEASNRLKVSGSEWVAMLKTDLATLAPSNIESSMLTLPVLSPATMQEITAALLEHVTKVIRGPQAYRTAAGVAQATAGTATVFSVKRGKEVSRPLLTLPVTVVGLAAGLAAWLLPGGDFSGGIGWGIFVCIVTWIWKFIYRHQKSESLSGQIGKYVASYCQRLEAIGIDKKKTSALMSQVPDVNPQARYAVAVGTVGVLTALVCTSNFFSSVSTSKASLAGGTQSRPSNVASPSTLGDRTQMEARRQAEEAAAKRGQETAARRQAEQELADQHRAEQAANAQRKSLWETEARSRYDSAQAEAQRVYAQALADAKNVQQRAQSQAQLEYRDALAEAQKNLRLEQSAAQVKNQVAQRMAQKVPALQGAAQTSFQQEQGDAQAKFKQAQASAQARHREAELDAATVHQKTQIDAQAVLRQAQAEAQKRYQVERTTGPTHGDSAQTAVATLGPARQAESAEGVPMAQDSQSGCKVWKPNLQPSESVTWSGNCADGYASGNGTARWSSGGKELLTYEGAFQAGVLQGKGVMTAAGGDRYEGNYKDGKRDGHGVYTTAAGHRYDGEFRENKKHGAGIATDANGVSAPVNFKDGQQVN